MTHRPAEARKARRVVTVLDIEAVADEYVVAALRKLHFSIVRLHTKAPGPTAIEAWAGTQHLFMHVNAAVAPVEPGALTPEQRQELRQRAARADGEAWEAAVVLGAGMELVRLDWWPLEQAVKTE